MKTIFISASFACLAMYGCSSGTFSSGTVTSIKIEAMKDSVASGPDIQKDDQLINVYQGSTLKLKAMLEGTGKFDSAVVWSIKDGTSKSKVSEEGVLSISLEQNLGSITVTATSKHTPIINEEFRINVMCDPKYFIGKWVRSWKSFRDTIIIEDNSVAVKLSNGKSFSYNKNKWSNKNNEDSYYKEDYPGGFEIIGLFDKGNVTFSDLNGTVSSTWKEIPASFPNDYPEFDADSKSGDQFSLEFFINKDKTKLCRGGVSDLIVYDRVK